MSGIHDAILNKIKDDLTQALITDIPTDDPARVGVVKLGDLQGEPDPDIARISLTLHENDPDKFIAGSVTGMSGTWEDEVMEVEIGGVTTWRRRFTVKARCLLERTREDLKNTRNIASTVRTRIEHVLPTISFSGIDVDGEYVSMPIFSENLRGEMLQGGGPPDSYDYFVKVRIELLTTNRSIYGSIS